MSEDGGTKLTRDGWAALVRQVLTDRPEWAGTTVEAMQSGLSDALYRQKDRVADLSLGLYMVCSTKPGQKSRNTGAIVKAIEQSTLHPTKWSAEQIARETGGNGNGDKT